MQKWNEICFQIKNHKNSSEKEIQQKVELIFEKLGWSEFKGEMIPKKPIPIGSAQSLIPDIILKNNDKNIIVVELKRNNISSTPQIIDVQLFSYMFQLKSEFGIFIGENLQFYYDVPDDNEKPIKIFETNFIENNEKAAEFISLISKPIDKPFDRDKLLEFCGKRILEKEKEKIFENLKGDINKGTFNNEVKSLFVKLLKDKYGEEIIERIINNIEIRILLDDSEEDDKTEYDETRNTKKIAKERREQFNFNMVNIEPGTILVFTKDEKEECIVEKDKKNVLYNKTEEHSLNSLTKKLMKKLGQANKSGSYRGPAFFKVKGEKETLKERRDRMEGNK